MLGLWETRQGDPHSVPGPRQGPGTPHAHVLGPCLHGLRSWEPMAPRTRTQGTHTSARLTGLLCPGSRPVCSQVSAKRCGPPGPRRRYQRVLSLLRTPCIRAGPFRAPVLGLERPSTRRHRPGADYVGRAPGARATPHTGGRARGRYVPGLLTIAGGRAGHAMCPASTDPLGTLRNAVFRTFPAFPAFPGFLAESGGPSLPF